LLMSILPKFSKKNLRRKTDDYLIIIFVSTFFFKSLKKRVLINFSNFLAIANY